MAASSLRLPNRLGILRSAWWLPHDQNRIHAHILKGLLTVFFHIFIYTAKVVTNTAHNSTYIHLLTIHYVTEFTFIACMQTA